MEAILALIIVAAGVAGVVYVLARRMAPLFRAAKGPAIDRIGERLYGVYWFPHHRMPRPGYEVAGYTHITTLVSLIVLSIHVLMVIYSGFVGFEIPGLESAVGVGYAVISDIALTVLFIACVFAAVRRGVLKPPRYEVPEKYGKDKSRPWAVFLVSFLAAVALLDMIYLGSDAVAAKAAEEGYRFILPLTGTWFAAIIMSGLSASAAGTVNVVSYFILLIGIFVFVNLLPFDRLFHTITGPVTVFCKKLERGSVKPVQWGVDDESVADLESFGVKKFEDFNWKHILDFYSCADCGRCSDNCPANASGRPLSPRFISLKGRDYAFSHYPLKGPFVKNEPLVGDIFSEDEIWSCTTCGACEEECPVTIEYIDKIVDLRRGMIDDGNVPQSLQKPLNALGKRGNPWGKMEKKRPEWIKELPEGVTIKDLSSGDTAETLYFVDSMSSYDDRMMDLARATATVLSAAGADAGILGKNEKDSANDVRRFGEEMLFMELRDHNSEMIAGSGAGNIVTSDPHALNALKKDYKDMPPVEHISEFALRKLKEGTLSFASLDEEEKGKIYTYHDPCYLGRHNQVYDPPREVMDAIPGMNRVEMSRCRDRSFCCGGGGLMLFYEPEEEERMGVHRVRMAKEAGANVIVTACPFCLTNIEDAIKVAGLEGEMEALDLCELVARHIGS
ncbi:MAG: 4Fe-4S dicluster domain-containing protein [Desulfobacteraceae bacterium]|nr:4Fe-4S dicluster domain-containing protein [Desulfobacteraceae bacterium]